MVVTEPGLVLLDPTQGPDERRVAMAPRTLASLDGLVIGFLDNSKNNAGPFLRLLERRLRERWKIAEAVHVAKPDASRIAPTDTLDELAARCHAVVAGVGD